MFMLNILNTQCSRDNMLVLYGDDDIIINTNYLKDVSPLSNIQTVFQSHVNANMKRVHYSFLQNFLLYFPKLNI